VDEEIGVAPDRRGEMGIARQRKPEVAKWLGAVAGLHLRAQNLLHDFGTRVMLADPLQYMVERGGLDDLPKRELDPEGGEIILERGELVAARRFVDAVHDRRFLLLKRLGRRDIGGDHIVLHQPVRVEAFTRGDRHDAAFLVKHHAALGKVELEWFAAVTRGQECGPAFPQRLECGSDQLRLDQAGCSVHRRLCIFVCNVCRDTNLGACESPFLEIAIGVDHEVAGQGGADLAFLE
jgi:hypothetical protein